MQYFTDFGTIEADSQESANTLAYVRWLEDGWAQGGYRPTTREEFETSHPELKNFQDFKRAGRS